MMCRMEEAKLLWAQGQQSMAMRVAWALLGTSSSAVLMGKLQRSRLQSLLGKWLSLNRLLRSPLFENPPLRTVCGPSLRALRAYTSTQGNGQAKE